MIGVAATTDDEKRLVDLMLAAGRADVSARAELAAMTDFLSVGEDGRAMVVVPRGADDHAFLGSFPALGGGIDRIPLPEGFHLSAASFEGDIFTLRAADGRSARATWRGYHALNWLLLPPLKAQWTDDQVDRVFFNLRPEPLTGSAVSGVAGLLTTADRPQSSNLYYEGTLRFQSADVGLMIRAANEVQLRGMIPELDRAFSQLPSMLEAARAFVVERGIATPEELATMTFSELSYYDGGAMDLCMSLDETSLENGCTVLGVHCDAAGRPVGTSFGG